MVLFGLFPGYGERREVYSYAAWFTTFYLQAWIVHNEKLENIKVVPSIAW